MKNRTFFGDDIVVPFSIKSDQEHAIQGQFSLLKQINACVEFIRKHNLAYGRKALLTAIERAHHIQQDEIRKSQMKELLLFSRWLDQLFSALRGKKTFGNWVLALVKQVEYLVTDADIPEKRQKFTPEELDIWEKIKGLMFDAERFHLQMRTDDEKLTLGDFVSLLDDLLSTSHYAKYRPISTPGTIRVLTAEDARYIYADHIIMASLNQRAYTGNTTEQPGRTLTQRIIPDHESHNLSLADEKYLFYAIITKVKKSLTLISPLVNELGEPLSPSPCVHAVKQLFSEGCTREHTFGSLDPVEMTSPGQTRQEKRIIAMKELLEGSGGKMKYLYQVDSNPECYANLHYAIENATCRYETQGLTKYEGNLTGVPEITEFLKRKYHAQYQFSATQLEEYTTCPFRFWEWATIED